jgi:hypothetical protein
LVVVEPHLAAAAVEPVVASRAEAAAVRPRLVLGVAAVVQERALLEAAASLRAEPALPILSTLSILVTK